MNIIFIDNFDSFTYNLVDEFEKRNHVVHVFRNNVDIRYIDDFLKKESVDLIVIPPGPSAPEDAGVCIDVIKTYAGKIPLMGVCLGHQCITVAFGGTVDRSQKTVHGKSSIIYHDQKGLFKGLESPLSVARYHSLCATAMPKDFVVSAHTEDDTVMAMRHKDMPIYGIQFHPESILTPSGGKMIENLIELIL
jgi:anthranilate synthase/aminodeoxychorismate synthase-like glutamine amidotransferase